MTDEPIITKVQLQRTQIDVDRELLRDEDLLNEEHLRRMDQVNLQLLGIVHHKRPSLH